MNKHLEETERFRKLIWVALAFLLIMGFVLQNASGRTYYSLLMEPAMTTTSPPVELHEGSAENSTSTIYANRTSAKVSLEEEGDFNYVLNFTERDSSNWMVRLSAYDQSNMSRLANCSIYIYDEANSTQIVILNGTYTNQTGPWYNLTASNTEYVWVHVEVSEPGTSYIYAYLEILVPNTTVYARYIITFGIE